MADNKASSPDFVKKLFQMLGEHEYDHIVRWAPQGDSFLVLDTNEFTKVILPRHFKHSNFASFVRQLNKYDFHKVRQTDQDLQGNPHGEGTWEFKHPEFNIHNGDSLDNIKRKAPAAKRVSKAEDTLQALPSPNLNGSNFYNRNDFLAMQRQMDSMKAMQINMNSHLQALTNNYQQVIGEMLNFQRNMVTQDQVMQNLISYLMSHANGPAKGGLPASGADEHAQKLVDEYSEVARQSYEQIEGMTRRVSHLGTLPESHHQHPSWPQYENSSQQQQQHHQQQQQQHPQSHPPSQNFSQFQHPFDPSANSVPPQQNYMPYQQMNPGPTHRTQSPGNYSGSSDAQTPGGSNSYQPSQVFQQQQQQQQQLHQQQQQQHPMEQRRAEETQRHMQQQQQQQKAHQQAQQTQMALARIQTPKEERSDPLQHRKDYGERFQQGALPNSANFEFSEQAASMIRAVKSGKKQITPWATPPKILLVEDDAVCRRLSSKFLTFFGCDIDTAFDGVSAVNLMNEKKYDLVLMDIVMPNLDGVSATSLIRQFDPATPIISMTSNVESGDVLTYFSHGMNDVLPKPFTKDGLLGMLEKHLMHLKTLKQLGLNGQERDVISMNGFEVAKTDLGTVSEADYLSMLSGLSGNAIVTVPPGNSNVRRSMEDLVSPEQGNGSKRAKLDD